LLFLKGRGGEKKGFKGSRSQGFKGDANHIEEGSKGSRSRGFKGDANHIEEGVEDSREMLKNKRGQGVEGSGIIMMC